VFAFRRAFERCNRHILKYSVVGGIRIEMSPRTNEIALSGRETIFSQHESIPMDYIRWCKNPFAIVECSIPFEI